MTTEDAIGVGIAIVSALCLLGSWWNLKRTERLLVECRQVFRLGEQNQETT